jgi:protein transport protein SEC20
VDNGSDSTNHAVHAPAPRIHRYNQKPETSSLSEKDRQTVGASSRATESLRQMHASLQSELERSEYANQTMKESSAAFGQLHESYSSLETMLSSSKDLLGTLMKSQKSDTWYLTTSFYMLVIVGAWLVFRRLIYGPVWWLVWLPLRMIFGVGSKVGHVALQGRGGAGESGSADIPRVEQVPVDGLPDKDLPTVQVGDDTAKKPVDEDLDSVTDKVGRIIDKVQEADELGSIPEEDGIVEDIPDAIREAVDTRPRDEL